MIALRVVVFLVVCGALTLFFFAATDHDFGSEGG
jgi:hypothetical protein